MIPLLTIRAGWAWAAAFTRAAAEASMLGALVALASGPRFRWFFWPMGLLIPLVLVSG